MRECLALNKIGLCDLSFSQHEKCGKVINRLVLRRIRKMSSVDFEQKIYEILSSTKNMEYADYRRLMFGEGANGTDYRCLKSYLTCPVNWNLYNAHKKLGAAVESIARAMSDYLISSPAPNTYKQRIYVIFCDWLDRIGEKYNISDTHKDYLTEPITSDMGIAFLKAFHREDAVTKKELAEALKIDPKSVQTWLRKIDSTLSEDRSTQVSECRIAGHHVTADIKIVDTDKYGKKYYQMPSTLHPLVLQPNVMQVGVLLKSLCESYNTTSFISYDIALDIWAQLSDYAKDRIQLIFGQHDKCLQEFLTELTDELHRSERIRIFKTEQEIMKDGGISPWEQICLALKNGAVCNIRLRNSFGRVSVYKNQRIISENIDGIYEYMAIPRDAEPHSYKEGIIVREDSVIEMEYL